MAGPAPKFCSARNEGRMNRPSLRRLIVTPASLMIILLCLSGARADLRFTQPRVDFGEVKSGAPLVHEFPFTNTGPETVEIAEIRASCGCLQPKLEPRCYKPGESGNLRSDVNTLTQAAGMHSWRIVVAYRQRETAGEQELLLTGTVVAEIRVEPPQLAIFADHAIRHELRVTDARTKALAITAVRATSPKLTPRVTGRARDAADRLTHSIRLDVAEDFPEGRHEEVLDIYTDDPLYRNLKVPVTIVKRSRQRFTATPSAVTLTASRGQAIPAKIVLIRDGENGTVEIERLTPSDPAIGCTWARGPGS